MPKVQASLFGDEHLPKAGQSQWYTPADLAKRIGSWSGFSKVDRLLEPSAGRGALIAPLPFCDWTAVELDSDNVMVLCGMQVKGLITEVVNSDFLTCTRSRLGSFDGVIMNPPYEGNMDRDFVMHALDFAPRVIALLRSAYRHGEDRWKKVWRWVDPVRQVDLVGRPTFGKGLKGDSPMSDFAVWELRRRKTARKFGEPVTITTEWWKG
jgi:predicted RNA methylase